MNEYNTIHDADCFCGDCYVQHNSDEKPDNFLFLIPLIAKGVQAVKGAIDDKKKKKETEAAANAKMQQDAKNEQLFIIGIVAALTLFLIFKK